MRRLGIILLAFSLVALNAHAAPQNQSDDWLEGRIQGALDFNSYFDSTEVAVEVTDGVVILTGKVPTDVEKAFAADIARKMDGVKEVTNNLQIDEDLAPRNRSDLEQFISDAATTAKVRTKLDASKVTFNSAISVETNNGIVFLGGTALSDQAKEHAENLAEGTHGVRGVKSAVKISAPGTVGDKVENTVVDIKKSVSDAWISTKVRSRLLFSSEFPGSDIEVNVKDGRVELKGYVRDAAQKDKLGDEINDIRGVKQVLNQVGVRRAS